MSLRAAQQIGVAARAAQRVAERAARISEMYSPEDSLTKRLLRQLADEAQEAGHYYSEDCQRPYCVEWRQFITSAMQQVMGQQGAPQ